MDIIDTDHGKQTMVATVITTFAVPAGTRASVYRKELVPLEESKIAVKQGTESTLVITEEIIKEPVLYCEWPCSYPGFGGATPLVAR